MRDASRGVSIARTKNIRRSTNNITTLTKETLVITIQEVTPEVIQTLLLLKETLLLVDREQLLEEAVLPV